MPPRRIAPPVTGDVIRRRIAAALRVKPQTAKELCERIGHGFHPRMISRNLGVMDRDGLLVKIPGHPARYTKP